MRIHLLIAAIIWTLILGACAPKDKPVYVPSRGGKKVVHPEIPLGSGMAPLSHYVMFALAEGLQGSKRILDIAHATKIEDDQKCKTIEATNSRIVIASDKCQPERQLLTPTLYGEEILTRTSQQGAAWRRLTYRTRDYRVALKPKLPEFNLDKTNTSMFEDRKLTAAWIGREGSLEVFDVSYSVQQQASQHLQAGEYKIIEWGTVVGLRLAGSFFMEEGTSGELHAVAFEGEITMDITAPREVNRLEGRRARYLFDDVKFVRLSVSTEVSGELAAQRLVFADGDWYPKGRVAVRDQILSQLTRKQVDKPPVFRESIWHVDGGLLPEHGTKKLLGWPVHIDPSQIARNWTPYSLLYLR